MAGRVVVSTLNNDTGVLATQNGMTGIAKAWVNFNGTGTVAIRDSFNVSSITDNGTGEYTVNFTTAMPNANYSIVVSQGGAATVDIIKVLNSVAPQTTSGFRILSLTNGFSTADSNYVYASVFSS
jgi:hypothetical protein